MIIQEVARDGLVTVQEACDWFGISRQAYYQAQRARQSRAAQDELILELVRGVRQRHPRLGTRKLRHELTEPLAILGIQRGRDAWFDLLRQYDLLVSRKRVGHRTTFSGGRRFDNLLTGLSIVRPQQVWVADITYLTTQEGYHYLALLTDAYSRFIVGYDLCPSLAHEGALRALDQALEGSDQRQLAGLIHHSDHGVQYTSGAYQARLAQWQMSPSMGTVGNCYDNALAERVNGILKNEYELDHHFASAEQAALAVAQAVWAYNYERPHLSLKLAKPAQVHGVKKPDYPLYVE